MAQKKTWTDLLRKLTLTPSKTYRSVIFALTDKDKVNMHSILQNINITVPNIARMLYPGERDVHRRFVIELDGREKHSVFEGLEDYGKLDVYFSHYANILPKGLVAPFKLMPLMPSGFASIDSLKIFQFRLGSSIPAGSAMAQFNYTSPGNLIGMVTLINGDWDAAIVHGPANLLKLSDTVSTLYSRIEKVMGAKDAKLIRSLRSAYGGV